MDAVAVHIGVALPVGARYARWARLPSAGDTVRRLTRLCAAARIPTQHRLLDALATVSRVRTVLAACAAATGPDGLLVLTFSGHGERPVPGEHHGGWFLHDGVIRHADTVELLASAHPSAHIVVIADTCHAAAFAEVCAAVPATVVLLAACGAEQTTLNHPVSEFVSALVQHTLPEGGIEPRRRSYADLARLLRAEAPDVERPEVYANRPDALRQRPFRLGAAPAIPAGPPPA